MITWGWTGMSHDASLAVFVDDKFRWARRTQQYTHVVNDKTLCLPLIKDALQFGKPKQIYFYVGFFIYATKSGKIPYFISNRPSVLFIINPLISNMERAELT